MTPVLDSIGPYQILGELGSGGMGVVYLARDPRLARIVAVKVIRAGGAATMDARRRFRVEAEAVGSLDHPGIVPILDVGDSAAEPYLALKFIPGGSLAERYSVTRPTKGNDWKRDAKAGFTGVILLGRSLFSVIILLPMQTCCFASLTGVDDCSAWIEV